MVSHIGAPRPIGSGGPTIVSCLVCSSSSAFSSAPSSTANALKNSQNNSTMTPKKAP
jgi:hypothetical protein